MRSGDETVTAEDIARLHAGAEHAQLLAEHAADRHAAATRRERVAALQKTREDIVAQGTADAAELLGAMHQIETGVGRITAVCRERGPRFAEHWRALLHTHRVPQTTAVEGPRAEDAGLGWRHASVGMHDRLIVDDRQVTAASDPGVFVKAAVFRGEAAAIGRQAGDNDSALYRDPQSWLTANL